VRIFLIDRLRDRFGARGMFEHFIVFDEEFTDVGKFIVFRDNVYDAVGFEIPKDFVAAFDFTIISDFPNLAMHKIEMTESPDEAIVTDLIGYFFFPFFLRDRNQQTPETTGHPVRFLP
jgi:hypothetical protein